MASKASSAPRAKFPCSETTRKGSPCKMIAHEDGGMCDLHTALAGKAKTPIRAAPRSATRLKASDDSSEAEPYSDEETHSEGESKAASEAATETTSAVGSGRRAYKMKPETRERLIFQAAVGMLVESRPDMVLGDVKDRLTAFLQDHSDMIMTLKPKEASWVFVVNMDGPQRHGRRATAADDAE